MNMQNTSTTIIIKKEIAIKSNLNNLAMLVGPGELSPLDRPNGDIEYIIESENSMEIKNFWDTLNESMQISCVNISNDDKTKSLKDVIKERMKDAS
ncbi:MAG: hypothetical protein KAR08_02680 [Candidatus Heimdallarchaeota archaeon]|nr:hypothetical protein [Candidatus Heimdallarchaeota archaeon]